MSNLPSVSIVIANLNGRDLLEPCLDAIANLEYPEELIECIVVDNGSIDGSAYYLEKHHPTIKNVVLGKNLGYASAINHGTRAATGELLFLLNNDATPDADCLIKLVTPIQQGRTECTTSQIIDLEAKRIHFAGGGMNFHGIAFQDREGEEYAGNDKRETPCLFPCGASMVIKSSVYEDVGGLDDDFFAYFEDVDLGWRLWLLGYQVLYVPEAITRHLQSETSRFIWLPKIRVLHIRNPLMMIYKNYDEVSLNAILPVAWMLTSRRTLNLSKLDSLPFRIDDEQQLAETNPSLKNSQDSPEVQSSIPSLAVSDLIAVNDWLENFESLQTKRFNIQNRRKRSDAEILSLFRDPFRYSEDDIEYKRLQDQLCEHFGINQLFDSANQAVSKA